jgi:hypothetical protein
MNKFRCVGGGPRYSKAGRTVLYEKSDLDSWIADGKHASTSEYEAPAEPAKATTAI